MKSIYIANAKPSQITALRALKLAAAGFVLFLTEATFRSQTIPNKNLGMLLKIWKI